MSINIRLLLVDDDAEATLSLTRALRAAGFKGSADAAGNEAKALDLAKIKDPHVAVVDLSLVPKEGVESGFRLIRNLISHFPLTRIVVLTGSASLEHGVRALNIGAAHFLEKPADPKHLLSLIEDSTRQSELRRAYEKVKSGSIDSLESLIVGNSTEAERIRDEVRFAASNSQALLITGETGTGKGLCAKAVHLLSSRSLGRLVRYQPNFSNADLVNSDLFGHEKGAFTGASEARKGLIAEAKSGTLFLDEIDELPPETQVTLLGVLQEKVYRPLGSNTELEANIRLICATNQDPAILVRDGKLRKDFFHRIAHSKIHLSALRERQPDIVPLSEKFLSKICEREQLSVFELSEKAKKLLSAYSWPGNIRELEATIESAAYRANYKRRSSIDEQDLQLKGMTQGNVSRQTFSDQVDAFKISVVKEALERNGGNQVKTAQDLEIDRSSLRRILARINR